MQHKLMAYAVSFAVVGIYWISHRRTYSRLRRADGVLDVLNLVMLGLLALLPLGTELLWENGYAASVFVYVGLVTAIGLAHALAWGYAAFIGKLTEPMSTLEKVYVLVRVALLPGLMCSLTFVSIITHTPWGLLGIGPGRRPRLSATNRLMIRSGKLPDRPRPAEALRSCASFSGQYRGKAIVTPPGDTTRPTSDRARQAVFNILEHAAWAPGAARGAGDRRVRRLRGPGPGGDVAWGGLLPVRRDRRRGARRDPREHGSLRPVRPGPGAPARRRRSGPAPRQRRRAVRHRLPRPALRQGPGREGPGRPGRRRLAGPGAIVMFERGRDEPDPVIEGFERLDARDYGAARVFFFRLA